MSELDKGALRAELRARRRAFAAAHPQAAERVAEILAAALIRRYPVVAAYRPVGSELDPGPAVRALTARGAAIALPVVVAAHAPLEFRLHTDAALVPDALGIAAPNAASPVVAPDLVLTPLLGFDGSGARLGQGGGFYDRTLAALRRSRAVLALGLAFSAQEIDCVPVDEYDQRLDGVVTEAGLRLF